jgi:hypothetical protein
MGLAGSAALIVAANRASATPYFANQTGLDCLSCHNNAPTGRDAANDLTATGRKFKKSGFNPKIFHHGNGDSGTKPVCHKEMKEVTVCD